VLSVIWRIELPGSAWLRNLYSQTSAPDLRRTEGKREKEPARELAARQSYNPGIVLIYVRYRTLHFD
jgi:hypothetical protein